MLPPEGAAWVSRAPGPLLLGHWPSLCDAPLYLKKY